mmetsp:Transcript_25669/g.102396  ORF Transcript_25669/g.102396 Transcript_25669/m.102396 type:complete len:318 (-) Transcript_25669:537-1490(-)
MPRAATSVATRTSGLLPLVDDVACARRRRGSARSRRSALARYWPSSAPVSASASRPWSSRSLAASSVAALGSAANTMAAWHGGSDARRTLRSASKAADGDAVDTLAWTTGLDASAGCVFFCFCSSWGPRRFDWATAVDSSSRASSSSVRRRVEASRAQRATREDDDDAGSSPVSGPWSRRSSAVAEARTTRHAGGSFASSASRSRRRAAPWSSPRWCSPEADTARSSASSTTHHSSCETRSARFLSPKTRSASRPGVPTTTYGLVFLKAFHCRAALAPPNRPHAPTLGGKTSRAAWRICAARSRDGATMRTRGGPLY